jgi:hypothetical protein
VKIVEGPPHGSWWNFPIKPLAGQTHYSGEEVKVDPEAHAAEKCHAAVIDEDGDITLVCTSPKRHRKEGESPVKTGLNDEQKLERRATIARNKAVREARDRRNEYLLKLVKRRIPLGELLPHLTLQWTHHADGRTLEIACDLLGIKVESKHGWGADYRSPLLAHAATSSDALARVGLAVALAASEQQQRTDHPQWYGEHLQLHFAFLEKQGYELADIERKELAPHRRRASAGQADTDSQSPDV